jgi:hypothetical protein
MNKFNIYSPDGQFLVATVNAETINIAGDIVTGTRGEGELAEVSFMLSPVGMVIDADQIVSETPAAPVGFRSEKTEPPTSTIVIDVGEVKAAGDVFPTIYNPNSIDLTEILEVGDEVIAYGEKSKISAFSSDEVYVIETSTGQSYTRFGAYQKTEPSAARDLKPVGFETWDEYLETKKAKS